MKTTQAASARRYRPGTDRCASAFFTKHDSTNRSHYCAAACEVGFLPTSVSCLGSCVAGARGSPMSRGHRACIPYVRLLRTFSQFARARGHGTDTHRDAGATLLTVDAAHTRRDPLDSTGTRYYRHPSPTRHGRQKHPPTHPASMLTSPYPAEPPVDYSNLATRRGTGGAGILIAYSPRASSSPASHSSRSAPTSARRTRSNHCRRRSC